MYLLVHQDGSKYFRLDYRFNGKRKTLALGVYPDTTLQDARIRNHITPVSGVFLPGLILAGVLLKTASQLKNYLRGIYIIYFLGQMGLCYYFLGRID